MFRKDKSKLGALFALGGSLFTFGGSMINAADNSVPSSVAQKIEDQSLGSLNEKISDVCKREENLRLDWRKFYTKFVSIYLENLLGKIPENAYREKMNEGKKLALEYFSINKSLLNLLKEYKEKLVSEIRFAQKELQNPFTPNKIKVIHKLSVLIVSRKNLSSSENKVISNLSYLEKWLLFADGKFSFPPFDFGETLMNYDDMRAIDKEYEISNADLNNTANNLYYIRNVCLNYYNDVKNESIEFNPSVWRSIMEAGESLLPHSIKLNEQFLDAYSKKYDSIKSNENMQELKNDVHKMIEHFESNLKRLNTWKNYISTNKNAQSLPDSIVKF